MRLPCALNTDVLTRHNLQCKNRIYALDRANNAYTCTVLDFHSRRELGQQSCQPVNGQPGGSSLVYLSAIALHAGEYYWEVNTQCEPVGLQGAKMALEWKSTYHSMCALMLLSQWTGNGTWSGGKLSNAPLAMAPAAPAEMLPLAPAPATGT